MSMRETLPSKTEQHVKSTSAAATTGAWRIAALVAGDILSFVVFTVAGRRSHDEALTAAYIVGTAFPFALGWFVVSPFAGAFRRTLFASPRRMLARTELAWVLSYPAALVFRVIFSTDHRMPISFAIVILVTNAVFLGGWRTAFAALARRR